ADRPSEGRSHSVQSRHDFPDQECAHAGTSVGRMHVSGSIEEPTQVFENSMSTSGPNLVPDEIARHRSRERKRRREPQAEAAAPRQGADAEQKGLSTHPCHHLLDNRPAKNGGVAVRAEEGAQAFHSGDLLRPPKAIASSHGATFLSACCAVCAHDSASGSSVSEGRCCWESLSAAIHLHT